ncbi:AfsR family transcriptional regulator [Streptomyces scabiei]|nr:AfsR family transcriptional regulator [Streptomyces sp. LBUM 1487]MBP5888862.1 AfsR family transcriptional regulator [Streptomyces sp. LBUM 1481]MBP5904569.1 AfsR family transcriptional regulator [Streptomyces sp. LBUM 1488]MBP5911767.1 AfsR family transcriptional regulator [Streptomyces sp. LBUM 1486]MBP5918883.1 AfsR family transcriptional regulator [Streptomyces sp. LBUM 1483]MBP5934282.1 AfsR family transcriptional regulator [Streptomyces sp. LBUM 1479]QTU51485.1 AfsR family transcript
MLTVRECLSVQLLGPVRAWRGDTEVVLGPPKQRAVLALLADRAGDVVSIEHIIDAVWGSDVPQTAANGVHTYVAGLRRVLDPGRSRRGSSSVLVSAAGGYCLRVSPDVVDLTRFTRCHAQARRARAEGDLNGALKLYQECLSLWRGEAYGGIPGPHAAMERTRLQDLRMTVVEEWASDMLRAGRQGEVVADLSAAVAEEPLREKLRWLLMLALYRCDRQAHALAVYTETQRLLSRELGIEPGAELANLHQDILAGREVAACRDESRAPVAALVGSAPHDRPRPAQLPPVARGFVGRGTELSDLEELLSEDVSRSGAAMTVAVVDGLAGVGKTEFALQLAHRLTDRFPDGQLFVDLGSTGLRGKRLTASEALGQLLSSLGVDDDRMPGDPAGRISLYRSLLHGRRMLVVLDDALSAEQARSLIPGGPSIVLVTSRHRLTGLVIRDGAHPITLGPLSERESTELLTYLGGDRLRHERAATTRMARICEGLPLALRSVVEALIAAHDVPTTTAVSRYADRRRLLDHLTVEGDAAANVRTVFEASYRALPEEAARMFRYLGLSSVGPITLQQAALLADTSLTTTRRLLDVLADRHLLERTSQGCYRFHGLIGIYAAECAEYEPKSHRDLALIRLREWEDDFVSRRVAALEQNKTPQVTMV